MAAEANSRPRITVDGKFFRLGAAKFHVKGVAYGPFAPNGNGEAFASPEQTAQDFKLIKLLGANLVRVYHVPPKWLLDLAQSLDLKVLVDIPWGKHLCFLDSPDLMLKAKAAVRQAAEACASHPATFALSVVNEIPPDVVRWSGATEVGEFIDELVDIVKEVDPNCLCTFANYPPTEFLHSQRIDFLCFNLYLHKQGPFSNYLARLQMIADTKPLMLGEFGMDSLRESEEAQGQFLEWQIQTAFRSGLAGVVVFSFTDDWHTGGHQIEDWAFGLTTDDRQPKAAYTVVRQQFQIAPYYPLPYQPKVSVVVASYNGARTLRTCLLSLQHLNYSNYEVILVDDGSTDDSAEIAKNFPYARYIRHKKNQGLSVARNTGIQAATGEIVAFTDSDCRADEDWLHYLVGDLLNSRFVGIGGHNFLPPEDSWVASAVMMSPGGPAHVMLTDRIAEHIPGCNMAFYKWALDEIGGFDPIFRAAGDDVDICWRLQQRGYRIGFSPAGFVWHYRRSNVRAYLKQQHGYGEAEAMLVRKHPEYFNSLGNSIWQGRIYTPAKLGIVTRSPVIYHGVFGSAFFQSIYTSEASMALMLLTSLEFHVLVTGPLFVVGGVFAHLMPLGWAALFTSLGMCITAAAQADMPKTKKHWAFRPLVALLFFLQPITRGWARYRGRLLQSPTPLSHRETMDTMGPQFEGKVFELAQYWTKQPLTRVEFLSAILEELDKHSWPNKADVGWNDYDIEIYGSRWCTLQLTTVAEGHKDGAQLFRCRLKTVPSLLAETVVALTVAFEILLIGFLPYKSLWAVLLLSVVGLYLLLRMEARDLRRIISVFLDSVAPKLGLTRVDLNRTEPAAPVAKAATPVPKTVL